MYRENINRDNGETKPDTSQVGRVNCDRSNRRFSPETQNIEHHTISKLVTTRWSISVLREPLGGSNARRNTQKQYDVSVAIR
jgi:hypothetical protein